MSHGAWLVVMEGWGKVCDESVMYWLLKASIHVWLAITNLREKESVFLLCAWEARELKLLMDSINVLSYQRGQVSRHLNERGKEPCGYGGGNNTCRNPDWPACKDPACSSSVLILQQSAQDLVLSRQPGSVY